MYIISTMAAILMTSLLGPDAELRWANWFKLLHMTQSLFWYRSPKIVTKFTRDAHTEFKAMNKFPADCFEWYNYESTVWLESKQKTSFAI